MNEADREMGNMARNPHWHGTLTTDVVDDMMARYSDTVYCNGYLRRIVFTPITENTIAFKTEAI